MLVACVRYSGLGGVFLRTSNSSSSGNAVNTLILIHNGNSSSDRNTGKNHLSVAILITV